MTNAAPLCRAAAIARFRRARLGVPVDVPDSILEEVEALVRRDIPGDRQTLRLAS